MVFNLVAIDQGDLEVERRERRGVETDRGVGERETMTNEWARDRARAVVNSVGFSESVEAAIAAALQQVADECAEMANERRQHFVNALSCENPNNLELAYKSLAATDIMCAIRVRFPRCPNAK